MKTEDLIKELKNSDLVADSPCGCTFKLSDVLIFDGTKPFPKQAIEAQKLYLEVLKIREEELKKKKKSLKKSEITTRAVNIGKSLEKILPRLPDFKQNISDCRFLGSPIDLIAFNGLSKNKINSIDFIEIKSGSSRLGKHQKSVKDAINDNKVSYKVIK